LQFPTLRRRIPFHRRRSDKALLYEIFCCQTPMAPGPPTDIKVGGRRGCSTTRYATVYVIQFSKICEPLPPTPYDENGRFRYCTSNSIHEAKSALEVVVWTNFPESPLWYNMDGSGLASDFVNIMKTNILLYFLRL
jgi:hypothetical protein